MRKLSSTQKAVLAKMQLRKWYYADELQCRMDTLEALYNICRVEKRSELGAAFNPRAFTQYRKIEIEVI